jgi:hypothetical protein
MGISDALCSDATRVDGALSTHFAPDPAAARRVTGVQKIVVVFSSTAASVLVTPSSMVRMIVSATTDGGQAVASGTGPLVRWASVGTRIVKHRGPTSPKRHDPGRGYPPATAALSFTKSPLTGFHFTTG